MDCYNALREQDRFIAAVAQAAGGVPVANVVIISITPHVPSGRRLLSVDDKPTYTVSAIVKGGHHLRDLEKHLVRHVGDLLSQGRWSTVKGVSTTRHA